MKRSPFLIGTLSLVLVVSGFGWQSPGRPNVAFYEYTEKPEEKAILDAYIEMKIKHYKEQDKKKADRDICCNYVREEWFMNHFKSNVLNI